MAAWVGERALVKFINLDYEAIRQYDPSDIETINYMNALQKFQKGEDFPVEIISDVVSILKSRPFLDIYRFDKNLILAKSRFYLDDADVKKPLKRKIRKYLYEPFQ